MQIEFQAKAEVGESYGVWYWLTTKKTGDYSWCFPVAVLQMWPY